MSIKICIILNILDKNILIIQVFGYFDLQIVFFNYLIILNLNIANNYKYINYIRIFDFRFGSNFFVLEIYDPLI